MTENEFIQIMDDDKISCKLSDFDGDNALFGLNLIAKYLPKSGIGSAEHDIICACYVSELVEAGITKEDVIRLKELNWMVENDEYLACFV